MSGWQSCGRLAVLPLPRWNLALIVREDETWEWIVWIVWLPESEEPAWLN